MPASGSNSDSKHLAVNDCGAVHQAQPLVTSNTTILRDYDESQFKTTSCSPSRGCRCYRGFPGSTGSFADVDTENLLVSASVTATCTITTAPAAPGAYDPTAVTDLDGTGTVTVLCTNGTAGYVTLGEGANADGASTPAVPVRQMAGGAPRRAD